MFRKKNPLKTRVKNVKGKGMSEDIRRKLEELN
jgi:hypothetical protein